MSLRGRVRANAIRPRHIEGIVSEAPAGRGMPALARRRSRGRGSARGTPMTGAGEVARQRDGLRAARVRRHGPARGVAAEIEVERHAARRRRQRRDLALVQRAQRPAAAVGSRNAPHDPATVGADRHPDGDLRQDPRRGVSGRGHQAERCGKQCESSHRLSQRRTVGRVATTATTKQSPMVDLDR